jgi:sulfiredoxin
MLKRESYLIADVRVPVKLNKTLDPVKVQEMAEDILENGQTTAITVRKAKVGFVLIEGFHIIEALKALGEDKVEGFLVRARLH